MNHKNLNLQSPMEAGESLAQRSRAMRLHKGWTRQTLAKRAGVTESSLKRFENNGKASLELVLKIAGVDFHQTRVGMDVQLQQVGERAGRLHRAAQGAGVDRVDGQPGQRIGHRLALPMAELREGRIGLTLDSAFGVVGAFAVSDAVQQHLCTITAVCAECNAGAGHAFWGVPIRTAC